MRHERGLVGSTREVTDYAVPCEAGEPIGEGKAGSGVRCRITRTNIASGSDPSSLVAFCLSEQGCRNCPVWRDDKHRTWERRGQLHLLPDLAAA